MCTCTSKSRQSLWHSHDDTSDRGTQFVNGIIRELLSLLQVEHEVSLAYSKEHNAILERANREVIRHLTAIIFDKRVSEAWSTDYLPLVQRIMNAKVHDTIGVSPAELLFGLNHVGLNHVAYELHLR